MHLTLPLTYLVYMSVGILGANAVDIHRFIEPLGRIGHTATLLGKSIYVVGGAQNIFDSSSYVNETQAFIKLDVSKPFDVRSPPWKSVDVTGQRPFLIAGHVAATDASNSYMLVSGGYTTMPNNTNLSWQYIAESRQWTIVPSKGGPINRHVFMAMANDGARFYVNGGFNTSTNGGDIPNEQNGNINGGSIQANRESGHVWNSQDGSWSQIPKPDVNVSAHTLSYVSSGNILVLMGGDENNPDGIRKINKLDAVHVFSPSNNTWRVQNTSGEVPEPRSGHTASVSGDNIIIYGGSNENGTVYNDVSVLNTKSWTWRKPKIENLPRGHAYSSAVLVGNTYMFIMFGYGRANVLDTHTYLLDISTWRFIDKYPGMPNIAEALLTTSFTMGVITSGMVVLALIMLLTVYISRIKMQRDREAALSTIVPIRRLHIADDSSGTLSIEDLEVSMGRIH
ncbi:hypothetical protein BDF22DRAFT_774527 [Syncephalis plumigaleata]|nr:hypothetical protein BDF22DRAFT_774527 [Syncephalis plumigaleata]